MRDHDWSNAYHVTWVNLTDLWLNGVIGVPAGSSVNSTSIFRWSPSNFQLVVLELNVTVFRCCDLDLWPMTLKLNRDLDILKMCLQTENEVARSTHSKLNGLNWESTRIALKVKGQGQMLPTSNRFMRSPWDKPSYINFRPVVFEIFCADRHRQTHRRRQKQYLLAAFAQLNMHQSS